MRGAFSMPLALALGLALGLPVRGQEAQDLSVSPEKISVDLLYGGTTVSVKARVPSGMKLAVLFEGQRAELKLKKKGRVWGVLWMNVADLEYEQVPSAYLVATSAPLSDLAPHEELVHFGLGYDVLAQRAGGDPQGFDELVKLKEKEGLYSIRADTIASHPDGAGMDAIAVEIPVVPKVPVGEYTVRLVGFQSGKGRLLGEKTLDLELAGAARLIDDLALQKGLLYGVAAVLIAIVAGLLTGLIFGRGGKAAH